MNIAIINNLYEPFERGGAERIAKLQRQGLLKMGHRVIVISSSPRGVSIEDTKDLFYLSSYFFNLAKLPKFLRLWWHGFDLINVFQQRKIAKILAKEKIELVITHNMTGLGRQTLAYVSRNFPHWHVLHDINLLHPSGLMFWGEEKILDSLSAKLYQRLTRNYFLPNTIIISPSAWLLDIHKEYGFFSESKQCLLIPNPVEIEPALSEQANKTSGFNFLYVGLLDKHKGIDLLIEAWQQLCSQEADNPTLKIIGQASSPVYLDRIKKMPNTEYLGKLSHLELAAHFQSADCLIMPSTCYENSPTVIYEAASFGLGFIASGLGGAQELANSLGGLSFEAGSAMALQKKMLWAINNPAKLKAMGQASRKLVSQYNTSSYIDKLEQVIESSGRG